MKGKLKILMNENIVDYNGLHIMTIKIMNSV